jgi:hypothetical protein
VSMTGIMDNRLMSGQLGMDQLGDTLAQVKAAAVKVRGTARVFVCGHGKFVCMCVLVFLQYGCVPASYVPLAQG